MSLPASRSAAKELNARYYFTGKACKNGHVGKRLTKSGKCVECNSTWCTTYSTANEQAVKNRRKVWAATNPDKAIERRRQTSEWLRATGYSKAWRAANRSLCRHYARLRQTRKQKATPAWVNLDEIKQHYDEADYISRLTGIDHEVDHIVPLRNSAVCGLHVPWNLQILTAADNRSKSNLFKGIR
jgi:5-methylcytosine-specific restriction endonuclease McrA